MRERACLLMISISGGGGVLIWWGGFSFVACLTHLTIDHASLSRRNTGRGVGAGSCVNIACACLMYQYFIVGSCFVDSL